MVCQVLYSDRGKTQPTPGRKVVFLKKKICSYLFGHQFMFGGRKETGNPQGKRGKMYQFLPLRLKSRAKAGGWEANTSTSLWGQRVITPSLHTACGTRHQQLSNTTNLIRIWTNDLHPITSSHKPFRSLREIEGLAISAPAVAQTMTLYKHKGCGDVLTWKTTAGSGTVSHAQVFALGPLEPWQNLLRHYHRRE